MVKASIVITTHNDAERILNLFKALSHQDFKNFEVIIVDLCSIDQTIEKVKSFPVKVFRLALSKIEIHKALNYAGRKCAGKIIFSLSGKNVPRFDNFVSSTIKTMENPKTVLVFGQKLIDDEAPIVKILNPSKWLGWEKKIREINQTEIKGINLDACAYKKGIWQKNNFAFENEAPIWKWASKLMKEGNNIKYNPLMAVKTKGRVGLINYLKQKSALEKQFNDFRKEEKREILA